MIQSPAFELAAEPRGEIYEALLRYAQGPCDCFTLIWREQLHFNPSAQQIAAVLKPDLIAAETTSVWPGTQLFGGQALMRRYRLSKNSSDVLQTVTRLYAWLAPNLPEDLAFYTSTGDCWLATVSHEKMGLFYNETSLHDIQKNVPGIVLRREISV